MYPLFDTTRINGINIITVASDLGMKLKRSGLRYMTSCPVHDEKNASLVLYHNGSDNHAYCFGCNTRLSVIDLVMKTLVVDFKQACEYLSNRYGIAPFDYDLNKQVMAIQQTVGTPVVAKPDKSLCLIDDKYLRQCFSRESSFVRWLESKTNDKERLANVLNEYCVGATRDGGVIYWQIDSMGRVRSGKVMHYHPDGHRVKDDDDYRLMLGLAPNVTLPSKANDWIHSIMMRQKLLTPDWQLTQCLFGEHLLSLYPSMCVAIVEAEKTAIIMAYLRPDLLWLATGGCTGLKEERLRVLKGRRVLFFPDSGKYDEWRNALQSMSISNEMKYSITPALEKYPDNYDIADLGFISSQAPIRTAPEQIWQKMKADNPVLEILETTLDLVPVEAMKINTENDVKSWK